VWHDKPRFRRTLRECWHTARNLVVPDLSSFRVVWRAVKGPIATVIANLTRVGWKATEPDDWICPNGWQWKQPEELGYRPNLQNINEALTESINNHLLKLASGHRFSGGFEGGIYFDQFRKHHKALSNDPLASGLLLAIGTAGLWPNERINSIKPEVSAECDLCHADKQDEAHTAWECDIVANNQDPRIQKSNHLRKDALRDLRVCKNECFWIRGLLPESWLPPRREIKERWQSHGDYAAFCNATHFGTDGAGGKHNSCPRLRGCGAGAAAVSHFDHPLELTLLGGISATVEGRQTVPRAELTAVCIVLALALQSHVYIYIDASYVFNGLKQ
jgi:hypothetical protein